MNILRLLIIQIPFPRREYNTNIQFDLYFIKIIIFEFYEIFKRSKNSLVDV